MKRINGKLVRRTVSKAATSPDGPIGRDELRLGNARTKARQMIEAMSRGDDPAAPPPSKDPPTGLKTFGAVAEAYLKDTSKRGAGKLSSRSELQRKIDKDLAPWNKRLIGEITKTEIVELIVSKREQAEVASNRPLNFSCTCGALMASKVSLKDLKRESPGAFGTDETTPAPENQSPTAFVPPFVELIMRAVAHFAITEDRMPKSETLTDWFQEQILADGRRISPSQAAYLATFSRPIAAMRGGNKRVVEPFRRSFQPFKGRNRQQDRVIVGTLICTNGGLGCRWRVLADEHAL